MVDPRLSMIVVALNEIVSTPNLPEANTFEHAQLVLDKLEQAGFVVMHRSELITRRIAFF